MMMSRKDGMMIAGADRRMNVAARAYQRYQERIASTRVEKLISK